MKKTTACAFLSLVFGCGESAEDPVPVNPCNSVSCQTWQQCEKGDCVPLAGRCDDYTDCAADLFCGEDHTCEGPIQPGSDLFESTAENHVTFEVKSLIHTVADLQSGSSVDGVGAAETHFGDTTQTLDEYLYAYRTTADPAHMRDTVRGKEVITWGISKPISSEGHRTRWLHIESGVTVLELIANEGHLETEELWLYVQEVETVYREFDGSVFRKYCLLAQDTGESNELFVNSYDNRTFGAGEDIKLWGTITVTEPNEITPATEEVHCVFVQDGVRISRDDYQNGITQTEPQLSCEMPPHFFDNAGIPSASFLFIGPINDIASALQSHGNGALSITSASGAIEVDDYYALAYQYADQNTDVLVYQTLGDLREVATNHYSFNMFRLMIGRGLLREMKQSGHSVVPHNPQRLVVTLQNMEEKESSGHGYYKARPLMVASATVSDRFLACTGSNIDFDPGEMLEIAGVLTLTDSATVVQDFWGITSETYCFRDAQSDRIDCAEFDAL